MNKITDEWLKNMFRGKLLEIQRWPDPTVGGYKVGLVLHIPAEIAFEDEYAVYKRVAKLVHLLTEKET